MIGAIPNPTKSFQVPFSLDYTFKACQHIGLFNDKYKFDKKNDLFSMVTFGAYEFLSLGVYADIQCEMVDENKTKITIEIRRKIGSFDQSYEITNANKHLQTIVELISTSIGTDENIRNTKATQQQETQKQTQSQGCLGIAIWLFIGGSLLSYIVLSQI